MHGPEMSEPKFTPDAKYGRFLALIGNYVIQFSKAEFNLGFFLAACTETKPTKVHFFIREVTFANKLRMAKRAIKERFLDGEDIAANMQHTVKKLDECSVFRNKLAHSVFLNDVQQNEPTMGKIGESYKEVLIGFEPLTNAIIEQQTEKVVKYSNEIYGHAAHIEPVLERYRGLL